MNEKRYFVSKKNQKNVEFTISHEVVTILGSETKRFQVGCANADDFSEFYDKLIEKQPQIRGGYVSKTTNSIGLYSRPYLASVYDLLSPTLSSQQELTSQAFQPLFAQAPNPISTPSISQNTQQDVDPVSSATNSNTDQLQSVPKNH